MPVPSVDDLKKQNNALENELRVLRQTHQDFIKQWDKMKKERRILAEDILGHAEQAKMLEVLKHIDKKD